MVAVSWVLCVAKGFGLWVFLVMVFSVEWVGGVGWRLCFGFVFLVLGLHACCLLFELAGL